MRVVIKTTSGSRFSYENVDERTIQKLRRSLKPGQKIKIDRKGGPNAPIQ